MNAILASVPGWLWLLIIVAIIAAVGNALNLWTITFAIGFSIP